jgi:NAD(P)-dependent dehydrogenase (short-subunit alcohol dehydrogenase family)
VESIRADGGTAEAFGLDITDCTACDDIVGKVSGLMGAVSVLVNNAGINRRTRFTGDPVGVIKDWCDIAAIDLDGVSCSKPPTCGRPSAILGSREPPSHPAKQSYFHLHLSHR